MLEIDLGADILS